MFEIASWLIWLSGSHKEFACHVFKQILWAIVGCVTKRNMGDFVNGSKTKGIVINFQRKTPQITPVNIQALDIEMVAKYKCLGVHLNNKLDWTDNTGALYKKGQSHLHLLRRPRSSGFQRRLLWTGTGKDKWTSSMDDTSDRLWKPRAALPAADSYIHCVGKSATTDHSSLQTSDCLYLSDSFFPGLVASWPVEFPWCGINRVNLIYTWVQVPWGIEGWQGHLVEI